MKKQYQDNFYLVTKRQILITLNLTLGRIQLLGYVFLLLLNVLYFMDYIYFFNAIEYECGNLNSKKLYNTLKRSN